MDKRVERSSNKWRVFSTAVLAEIAEKHRNVLRKHRVTEPAESAGLTEWAYRAMEQRTRKRSAASKSWSEKERLQLYLVVYRSAEALRELALSCARHLRKPIRV